MAGSANRRLAEAIIADIEGLTLSQGEGFGDKFICLPWEKRFIRGMVTKSISCLTIGRGNGKTTVVAGIASSALKGALRRSAYRDRQQIDPVTQEVKRRWREKVIARGEILIIASSLGQGGIAFKQIKHFMQDRMIGPSADRWAGKLRWRINDSTRAKVIEDLKTGIVLRVLPADPDRAHGQIASLIICDEPAKWKSGGREMFIALETGMGKQPGDMLVLLGTRPKDEGHFFSEMLDSNDPNIYVQSHAARIEDPDFQMRSILRANPSYNYFPTLRKTIQKEMRRAKQSEAALLAFRALRLNKGTPETEQAVPIVSMADWAACETLTPPERRGPVAIGVDLGGGDAMSAVAFYYPETGLLVVYGHLPAMPDLEVRGKADGVGNRYRKMEQLQELWLYPGRASNNVRFLSDAFDREKVRDREVLDVVADKYKFKDLEQALYGSGIHREVVYRRAGQGPDGFEDINQFQKECYEGHLKIQRSLLMRSAIGESYLKFTGTGLPYLEKSRKRGRNDALSAGILAVGCGRRWRLPSGPPPREFRVDDYVLTELYNDQEAA